MKALLIAAAIVLFSAYTHPATAAQKLSVWVTADDHPELQDSAQDIIKKFKSKHLELAESPDQAEATITVKLRGYMPTGDYYISVNNIGQYATISEGGKATVVILVEYQDQVEVFKGQTWNNSWTGAANNARKAAEEWLTELQNSDS